MGIVRTLDWTLRVPPDDAERRLLEALAAEEIEAEVAGNTISAKTQRSMRKNRWAAELRFDLNADENGGTIVHCRVEMNGNKHFAILDEVAAHIDDDIFEDGGLKAAVEQLGKASRIFGRKEIRHLRAMLRPREHVACLGQGTFAKKQGIVALTDQRLFFLEKSIGSETLEEFQLTSISSLQVQKKITGERLVIHASGNTAEITHLMHGQADALTRAFREVKERRAVPPTPAAGPAPPDVLDQLRKLGELRDNGVLTPDEFEDKKAAFLDRL